MSIQTRIVNDSYTEIYIGGGDTLITQSAPTNFHGFWTRKLLNKGETVADFREITASEMESLKAADAKWTRPPQSFIDLWNAACGQYGKYNEGTGYFELNGLTDISYQEAQAIYALPVPNPSNLNRLYHNARARTHLPYLTYMAVSNGDGTFNGTSFEVIIASDMSSGGKMFANCRKLKKVDIYSINSTSVDKANVFAGCAELVTIKTSVIYREDFSVADSPLLSLGTVRKFVQIPAASGNPFTITVHPEVYAKLTDETNTEWHALLAQAATKQINFTTV